MRGLSHLHWIALLTVSAVACSTSEAVHTTVGGSTSTTGSPPDTETSSDGGSTGMADDVPPECGDRSLYPWKLDGCEDALHELCATFSTESDCNSNSWWFEDSIEVHCSWAQSARLTDANTCSADRIEETCVATFSPGDIECHDACLEVGQLYNTFQLVGDKLFRVPCRPGARAAGILGDSIGGIPMTECLGDSPLPAECDCGPLVLCP